MEPLDPPPQPHWRRTLYILFIAQLMTSAGFQSMFPFLPLYVQKLGTHTALSLEFLAGMAYSAQAITMMLSSPVWGAVADRYGRKLMVERAMFGGMLIMLLMAFVRSAEELVLLRAIQGLITGTISAANAMAAAAVPRQQVGYAMGLLQVGLAAGVALGPMAGGALADAYGYQAAFFVTAGTLLFSGLLVWWGVQENFARPQGAPAGAMGLLQSYRLLLSAPGMFLAYSLRFISQLGRYLLIPIAPLFIKTLLDETSRLNTMTGLVSGIAALTTAFSSVYLGRLSDRIGPRRILAICGLAAAGLYLLHTQVNGVGQLLVLQALVGITLGGIVPSISALLARLSTNSASGAVYGLDNSIDAAGRSLAPLLGSALAVWISLRATFTVSALLYLSLSLLAIWLLPASNRGLPQKYMLSGSRSK